jgi:uncharacterized protein (DUF302 family)
MAYYFSKRVNLPYEKAVEAVKEQLKNEGFGVLTEIDVRETLKAKLGVEFPKYRILGACNPKFAHQALLAEDKIGTMLPCNVIVQERKGAVEVAAVDPVASMTAVGNPALEEIAKAVRRKLQNVLERL